MLLHDATLLMLAASGLLEFAERRERQHVWTWDARARTHTSRGYLSEILALIKGPTPTPRAQAASHSTTKHLRAQPPSKHAPNCVDALARFAFVVVVGCKTHFCTHRTQLGCESRHAARAYVSDVLLLQWYVRAVCWTRNSVSYEHKVLEHANADTHQTKSDPTKHTRVVWCFGTCSTWAATKTRAILRRRIDGNRPKR